MNILFLTSRLPYPPNRGDKVRTFILLKEFSKIYKITLFSLIESPQEAMHKDELLKYCDEVILVYKPKLQHLIKFSLGFFNSLPFQVNYYKFPQIEKMIKQLIKTHGIEIIYTHLIRMAPAVQNLECYKILDYTDAISMEYERSLQHRNNILVRTFFSLESKRTRKYEQSIISKFNEAWFISQEDINHLELHNNHKIKVVPNPVKIGITRNDYILKNRIVFVGNMSVSHNISAVQFIAKQIMPRLLKIFSIEFFIIGAQPSKEVIELNGINNTKVIGYVDDLFSELSLADIFVAPMFYSAGVQNKVLEAMTVGLPVVTTGNVARSIMAESNKQLLTAESTSEYIKCISLLLKNEILRKNIGTAGKNHILNHFSISHIRDIIRNTK